MFSGVYSNRERGARDNDRGDRGGEENKAAPTKPVFTGKGKFKTGGGAANNEPASNTPSMNYDFSKMRMSAAKSGGGNRQGGDNDENRGDNDGERRRGGPRQGGAAAGMQQSNSRTFGDDDDFEVVTDKKKGGSGGFRRGGF